MNLNVLDTPPQSRYYDSAVPRDQIVALLTDKINAGNVTITLGQVNIVPSVSLPPSPCPSNVQPTMTTRVPLPSSTCSGGSDDNDDSSLSTGAAAGLTIGVFVLGVVVGVISTLLTCWVLRSRVRSRSGKYNTSSYSKQRDDAVI